MLDVWKILKLTAINLQGDINYIYSFALLSELMETKNISKYILRLCYIKSKFKMGNREILLSLNLVEKMEEEKEFGLKRL